MEHLTDKRVKQMGKERLVDTEAVTRDLLTIKASDAICRYITSHGLSAGDRIPSERELAGMLNVGRSTLRGALNILEKEKIVERFLGKGTFVGSGSVPDNLDVKLLRVNYRDLLEIKIWLDQLVICKACKNATEEQLSRLQQAAGELERQRLQGVYSIPADRVFHQCLMDCGGNDTLSQLLLSLIDAMNDYSGMLSGAEEFWLETIPYHTQIAQALQERNREFALAALQYIYQCDLKVLDRLAIP